MHSTCYGRAAALVCSVETHLERTEAKAMKHIAGKPLRIKNKRTMKQELFVRRPQYDVSPAGSHYTVLRVADMEKQRRSNFKDL